MTDDSYEINLPTNEEMDADRAISDRIKAAVGEEVSIDLLTCSESEWKAFAAALDTYDQITAEASE